MSSNMYPYTRPTEGGTLAVSENGIIDLAGTNYSKINVNVSGGGGEPLGELVAWPLLVSGTPVVGGEPTFSPTSQVKAVKVGSSYVVKKSYDWETPLESQYVASGASVVFTLPDAYVSSLTGYVVTLNGDWSQYVTVEPWSGAVTKETSEAPSAHDYVVEMPLLQNGEVLVFEIVTG